MKQPYEAPKLYCDEYAADTMIASNTSDDDLEFPSLGENTKESTFPPTVAGTACTTI